MHAILAVLVMCLGFASASSGLHKAHRSHGHSKVPAPPSRTTSQNRYSSFAPQRTGHQAKWYVDGCSYFWAVSEAIENAKESIWILDWWLSPELYLRRPPASNEKWRLDRTLLRAAQRGVKINVIMYKEVPQVLPLDSKYSQNYLQGLSPNIVVFRHPDHISDRKAVWVEFIEALKGSDMKFTASVVLRLPGAALRALFGGSEETILYWAHHEKLCIIDGSLAFMGGLDLSFGRWDTNDHPIADLHPGNANRDIWVGQDYNNARIADFKNVSDYQQSTIDRRYNSRMGWSDISISIIGPAVEDLRAHFVQRWNWVYKQKYKGRAQPLPVTPQSPSDCEVGPRSFCKPKPDTMNVQITRSVGKWSQGVSIESSILHAYIDAIQSSEHFVYIENQFFISMTANNQKKPIRNTIGKAIIERIKRAHKNHQDYKIIVVIPAVPAFAGDLKSDAALSTRAIMEFQYYTIIRGGKSIYEELSQAGIDPKKYIRFYNLRNFDRINNGAPLRGSDARYDSVTSTYMTPQVSIKNIPWSGPPQSEIDSFVSEELYVHSKVLIADDRVVICGSANLNDRSMLGYRDSEIAAVIEDSNAVGSSMAGKHYVVNRFASSLRRFLMRKHLGLLPVQDYTNRRGDDPAFQPVRGANPNRYDWGSSEDRLVADPLSDKTLALWERTARTNTEVFDRVFRPVPADDIRTWRDYDVRYQRFFPQTSPWELKTVFDKAVKDGHPVVPEKPSTWQWGHVVAEDMHGGVKEVKDLLSRVRGTVVEMPLRFLIKEDIAKWGLTLNPYTELIYT